MKLASDDRSDLQRAIDAKGGPVAFLEWWERQDPEQRLHLSYDWEFVARKKQLPPPSDWQTWHVRAGRGFGKTRTGAEWVRAKIERAWCRHGAIVAPTAADARDVMIEGVSGILSVCPRWNWPEYEPSKRRITWPSGAQVAVFSAEEPDRLRGPQYEFVWCDELAAWERLQETWDMIQFGLREGTNPQALVTSTPRGLPFLRALEADPATVTTTGSTYENAANLAPKWFAAVRKKYEGTRLGRQEIDAEILDDNPGALWKRALIDAARVDHCPQLSRIVIPWDPATTSDATSDEHGILAVGAGMCSCQGKPDLHGFVLEDCSAILSPNESCERVASVYERRRANTVIGETNQGGDFIEALLHSTPRGKGLAYHGVHAKDGKRLRAEPVASLYEQGKVHHVSGFPKLEDEMCTWDPLNQVESPNRVDALVHGLTDLLVKAAPPSYKSAHGVGFRTRV